MKSFSNRRLCLVPQHGAGVRPERPIVLAPRQADLVARHPGRLLCGLFHSDGCRITNWATNGTATGTRRYEYPRYFFSNRSEGILGFCAEALDRLGISHRRSRSDTVSVGKRPAVAALDLPVGAAY